MDPLNMFYLDIYRVLKQCMCYMLLLRERFIDPTRTGSVSVKSFSYMRNAIIKNFNRFIVDSTTITNENPSEQVLNVDFRAGMNGYLNDDGFCGMLDHMIIRKLKHIWTLFGILVELLCGLERHGLATDVFSLQL